MDSNLMAGLRRIKRYIEESQVGSVGCFRLGDLILGAIALWYDVSMGHAHPTKGAATGHKLYGHYHEMLKRCTNPNYPDYPNYGGRGISICARWLPGQSFAQGFWNFVEDMGCKPFPKAEVDRIDVDGNYTPSNCRWATKQQQIENRRLVRDSRIRNAEILADRERGMSWAELGKKYDLSSAQVSRRLQRARKYAA